MIARACREDGGHGEHSEKPTRPHRWQLIKKGAVTARSLLDQQLLAA
jgi:hypothetical protein